MRLVAIRAAALFPEYFAASHSQVMAETTAALTTPKKVVFLTGIQCRSVTSSQEPMKLDIPSWITADGDITPAAPAANDFAYLDEEQTPEGARTCPASKSRNRRCGTVTAAAKLFGGFPADDQSEDDMAVPREVGNEVLKLSLERAEKLGLKLPLVPPGLAPPPATPSHGSVLHGMGNCKPCAWFWKPGGCQNGLDCLHCHLCSEGEVRARKKQKFVMMRLGLATPKMTGRSSAKQAPSFAMELDFASKKNKSGNEGSTTCSGSEEEPQTVGQAPSSEDEAGARPLSGKPELSPRKVSLSMSASQEQDVEEHSSPAFASRRNRRRQTEPPKMDSGSHQIESAQSIVTLGYPSLSMMDAAKVAAELPDDVPSMGSALHSRGECRPCAWFYKQGGCQNAKKCFHCHLCPEGEIKQRRKAKATSMRYGLVTPTSASQSGADQASFGC